MNGMKQPFIIGILALLCYSINVNYCPSVVSAAINNLGLNVKDIRPGERYSGGTRLRSPLAGISFVVPKDWRASLPAGNALFLDSAVNPGIGIVHILTDVTKQAVLEQLSEPQSIEAGFLLHPVGSIQDRGSTLTALFAGGEDMAIVIARIGPSSNAVIYQFIGRKTEEELYGRLVKELASSTQFMNPEDALLLTKWYERLTGRVLHSERDEDNSQSVGTTSLHLCGDGRFIRSIRLRPVPGRPVDVGDGGTYHETGGWLLDLREGKVRLILAKSTGASEQWGVFEKDGRLILGEGIVSVELSLRCL